MTRYTATIPIVLCLALATSGCVTPRVMPDMTRPGIAYDDRGQPVADRSSYVSLDQAVAYGDSLKRAWRKRADILSASRFWMNVLLIGLATSGVGLAATGASSELLTGIGLGGGAVAAFGTQFFNRQYSKLYLEGAKVVECVISVAQRKAASNPGVPGFLMAKANLDGALDALEFEIAAARSAADAAASDEERRELVTLEALIAMANATLIGGRDFSRAATSQLRLLDPWGHTTVSAIEGVLDDVNLQITEGEPDLLSFDTSLARRFGSIEFKPAAAPPTTKAPQDKGAPRFSAAFAARGAALLAAIRMVEVRRGEFEAIWKALAEQVPEFDDTTFQACTLSQIRSVTPPENEERNPPRGTEARAPEPDPDVVKVQKFLKDEQKNAGNEAYDPKGQDGIWGPDTKKAAVAYLTDNAEDLREGEGPVPSGFGQMDSKKLVAFVLILAGEQ